MGTRKDPCSPGDNREGNCLIGLLGMIPGDPGMERDVLVSIQTIVSRPLNRMHVTCKCTMHFLDTFYKRDQVCDMKMHRIWGEERRENEVYRNDRACVEYS